MLLFREMEGFNRATHNMIPVKMDEVSSETTSLTFKKLPPENVKLRTCKFTNTMPHSVDGKEPNNDGKKESMLSGISTHNLTDL